MMTASHTGSETWQLQLHLRCEWEEAGFMVHCHCNTNNYHRLEFCALFTVVSGPFDFFCVVLHCIQFRRCSYLM